MRLMAVALMLSTSAVVSAREPLPLFDAHVHFSVGATSAYAPAAAMTILDAAGIRAAILSSTPNDGTLALFQAYPDRFIPFVRPYNKTRDLASWGEERRSWYRDPQTLPFIEKELARGIYHGIGEFHVDGDEADSSVIRGIVELAARRNLWLMAHSDAAAIEKLYAYSPNVRILWAHTGMSEPASKVAELLALHPTLVADLSYRSGVSGGLTAEWRELLLRFPDRFVYGSDTWVPSRWAQVGSLTSEARGWLSGLPPAVAEAIAYRNGLRMFGAMLRPAAKE